MAARSATLLITLALLLAKLAALALLVRESPTFAIVPAFVLGCGADALVVFAAYAVFAVAARRVPARFVVALGCCIALYIVTTTYFVELLGAPLSYELIVYGLSPGQALSLGALTLGPVTTLTLISFVVLVAVGIRADEFREHFWSKAFHARFLLMGFAGVALVIGSRDAFGFARYGLDRNAVTELIVSSGRAVFARRARADMAALGLPTPKPSDPSYTEAVTWERTGVRPRHLVIWVGEGIGARHVGLYGEPRPLTPRLDAMRSHSLRFSRYYATTPVSIQALFEMTSGLYPNPGPAVITRENPRIAARTLMEELSTHGYTEAFFHGGFFAFTDKLDFFSGRGFSLLLDAKNLPGANERWGNPYGTDDRAIVQAGLDWLDGLGKTPPATFALFVPIVPHHPYFLPPAAARPFGEDSERDRYDNGVLYEDTLFGELYDAYAARGLADDTLFVFVGDHGQAFGEHPLNRLHASFVYEENVHSALVLVNPRLFDRELVSGRLGDHADLLPTVLDLLGFAPPASAQGQSLVSENFHYKTVPLATFAHGALFGLRDGDKKYIWHADSGEQELYDLSIDPNERRNLAADETRLTRAYRLHLEAYREEQERLIATYPKLEGHVPR